MSVLCVFSDDLDFATEFSGIIKKVLDYPCVICLSREELEIALAKKPFLILTEESLIRYDKILVLKKPIRIKDLCEQISSFLQSQNSVLSIGNLFFYTPSNILKIGEKSLSLSEKEFNLLKFLAFSPDQKALKEEILSKVWGYNENVDSRTLESHIYKLRIKLSPFLGEEFIQKIYQGYHLIL